MKKAIILITFVIFLQSAVYAQFSGIFETTVAGTAGAGDAADFSCGLEVFANLRYRARLREIATVEGALNLLAAAGDYAIVMKALNPLSVADDSENFAAAIEIERLFFRLDFDTVSLDGGLFRLPFGYSQVWKPTDFLNPTNPLKPDARPRAILGAALAWFPAGDVKLLAFSAAPKNPFSQGGDGWLVGLSAENHWNRVSLQGLYSYELPITADEDSTPPIVSSKYGIHRIGLSVKADVKVGLFMDALYTYNHEAKTTYDGLSLSAGIDYSFLRGDLIVLAEYLYNGKTSATAAGYGGDFFNEHYLMTSLTWRINDLTNIVFSLISGFSDISFTPIIVFSRDVFNGATLSVTAMVPIDRDLFHQDGRRGELGPIRPDHLQPWRDPQDVSLGKMNIGSYFTCNVKLRLRF